MSVPQCKATTTVHKHDSDTELGTVCKMGARLHQPFPTLHNSSLLHLHGGWLFYKVGGSSSSGKNHKRCHRQIYLSHYLLFLWCTTTHYHRQGLLIYGRQILENVWRLRNSPTLCFCLSNRPQGNGQVKVTNRAFMHKLKKKIESAKG